MPFRGLSTAHPDGDKRQRAQVVVWSVLNLLHVEGLPETATSIPLWRMMARQFDPELRRAEL